MERDNVSWIVERLHGLYGDRVEVVVVDDDSPDGTWLEALRAMVRLGIDGVVVRRINVRGLSSAILDGIYMALSERVVIMDADGQHPPEKVGELAQALEGADVAVGTRYAPGGGVAEWSPIRKLISRAATLVAKLLLPEARRLSDPMSGFFAVKRSIVVSRRRELNPLGFKALLEILVKCRIERVAEVPYTFAPRRAGRSKLGTKQIIQFILHVLRLSRWRPLRFATVGAAGTVVNLATLALLSIAAPVLVRDLFIAGSAIAIEVSTLFNFSMHERWTFRDRRFGSWVRRLAWFHAAVAPAIAAQYSVANALHYGLGLHPIIAQFIGILVGFTINYTISELRVWAKR